MKKRFLALCLTLALLFGLVPAGVSAAGEVPEQTWSHLTVAADGKTATGYCPHCCDSTSETVTWTLFTRVSKHNALTKSGHYFLNEDTNVNDRTTTTGALRPSTVDMEFVLHLNGKTFVRTGSSNTTGVIYPAADNTSFYIVDDQAQEGALVAEGGWVVSNGVKVVNEKSESAVGTKVVLYSGNLTSTVATVANANGGAVNMSNGATFEMYDGTVNGSIATYGGALFVGADSTANIYGGTIQGGTATARGGNIYMSATTATLNIYGGTIQNGTCQENGIGGGNIFVNNGTFNLTGGTVTGGKGAKGGNIYANTATTINGTATIANGTATANGGNLYVASSLTLGAVSFANGKAAYGSDIYVSTNANMTVDAAYNGVAKIYYSLNHIPDTILGGNIAPHKNRADQTDVAINRCTGVFSGKLYLENDAGMPLIYAKNTTSKFLWIANTPSAALVDDAGNYTWYDNNDAAVAAYNADTAYMVAGGASLPVTGDDYVIDLAGHDVTISGTGSVTLFDSANADYETYGTATVEKDSAGNLVVGVENGIKTTIEATGDDYYMVKTDTNKYTFHRMGVKLAGVSVRPEAAGMYYTGIWQCDDLLAEKVVSFGVAVSLANRPQEDFAEDGDTLYTQFGKADFVNGVAKTGVIITGILKDSGAQNNYRARQKVYAAAYVVLEDGAVAVGGSENSCSLNSALQLAEDNRYAYAAVAEDLQNFCDTWKNKGVRWDMDFTLTADEQAILEAYEGKTAYQGEAHDHAATGGNSDGNFTLNQWKQDMEIEGLDFTTIVDHRQTSHMEDANWGSMFIGGTEASTNITDSAYAALKSNKLHYSLIFTDQAALDEIVDDYFMTKTGGIFSPYTDVFEYKNWSVAQLQEIIDKVQKAGGMFTIVHPKSDGYIASDDPLMYYFADWTGLEVFYGAGGYAPTQAVNKENYKLWTDLLAAGKKVWATAGSDQHAGAGTNALTTIYSDSASAEDIFEYMKTGNSTCGPVGIRMIVGDTFMGSETDFAGKHLSFSVGDFHESIYNPDHTYRVKLISDTGVVYETTFDASKTFIYGVDAVETAKFYRVEVWDDTAGYDLPIAIGNPIWNNGSQIQ